MAAADLHPAREPAFLEKFARALTPIPLSPSRLATAAGGRGDRPDPDVFFLRAGVSPKKYGRKERGQGEGNYIGGYFATKY